MKIIESLFFRMTVSCLFFLAVIIVFSSVNAGNVYVSPDQPSGWYDATHVKTVNESITNASAGDIIYVWDGIYFESNTTIDRQITMIGNSTSTAIIDANYNGSPLIVEADGVNISYLGLIHCEGIIAEDPQGCGIWVDANYLNVSYCDIRDNNYRGIIAEESFLAKRASSAIYTNQKRFGTK